jgi:hypothetical protein
MTEERIAEIVAEAVKAAMKEDRNELWISQPQHFMDHQMLAQCRQGQDEWRRNHEFISSVRQGMGWGKKAGVVAVATATVIFIAGAIWMAIKAALHYQQ